MYVITNKEQLEGKYSGLLNTLPDGRVYFPISEVRNVGSIKADICTGRELTELKEQLEKGGKQ